MTKKTATIIVKELKQLMIVLGIFLDILIPSSSGIWKNLGVMPSVASWLVRSSPERVVGSKAKKKIHSIDLYLACEQAASEG